MCKLLATTFVWLHCYLCLLPPTLNKHVVFINTLGKTESIDFVILVILCRSVILVRIGGSTVEVLPFRNKPNHLVRGSFVVRDRTTNVRTTPRGNSWRLYDMSWTNFPDQQRKHSIEWKRVTSTTSICRTMPLKCPHSSQTQVSIVIKILIREYVTKTTGTLFVASEGLQCRSCKLTIVA